MPPYYNHVIINHMKIRLIHNKPKIYLIDLPQRDDKAYLKIFFLGGRYFDPPSLQGLGHTTEHCIAKHIIRNSGKLDLDATTDTEFMIFNLDVNRDDLILATKSFQRSFTIFKPNDADIEKAKIEILDEKLKCKANEAYSWENLSVTMASSFLNKNGVTNVDYFKHWKQASPAINAKDIIEFYRNMCDRGYAVLIYASDLSRQEILQIKKITNNLKSPNLQYSLLPVYSLMSPQIIINEEKPIETNLLEKFDSVGIIFPQPLPGDSCFREQIVGACIRPFLNNNQLFRVLDIKPWEIHYYSRSCPILVARYKVSGNVADSIRAVNQQIKAFASSDFDMFYRKFKKYVFNEVGKISRNNSSAIYNLSWILSVLDKNPNLFLLKLRLLFMGKWAMKNFLTKYLNIKKAIIIVSSSPYSKTNINEIQNSLK